jgi:RNA polymerase sigma-70 factor (ECF subfamily)
MSEGEVPQGGGDDLAGFLARIQAGDEEAARELLHRYEAEVRLVVRRQLPRLLRSRFDSLDFLQSVWGDFFQKVRTGTAEFSDSKHLVAFLARAAKNKVIDQYRRAGSLKQDMHREEPIWSEGGRPRELEAVGDTASQLFEAREAFDRLLDLLPADRRHILALKAEGLSSREIGERLGLSERTIQRVIEDLRRRARPEDEPGES